MKAVIFAAGLGTRLRPLTDAVPKPLLDVGGKPILQRTLEALPASVTETIVVVGYKGDAIRAHLADVSGVRFVEQPELLGTYDALMSAHPHLDDAPFIALNGDDLYAKDDLERLAAADPFAMLAHRVPNPNPYSHLESSAGRLGRIVFQKDAEALPSKDVYVGACLLDPRFFGLEPGLTPSGEFGLPHTLEKHLDKIAVRVLASTFWMPVGTPDELAAARAAFGG
jgi:bifunctional UDP-N-acetylglucosamine pyrophosphorylase/glucosamine-1-phosphate N-acetyltransferase